MPTRKPRSLRARLHALTVFLPQFEDREFQFGAWSEPVPKKDGFITLPYYTLGETAAAFEQAVYHAGWVTDFDWPKWFQTAEAAELRDNPRALVCATPEQLARLLTTVVRQERYSEGSLAIAHRDGLLLGILRRAKVLEEETPAKTAKKAPRPRKAPSPGSTPPEG